MGWQALQVRRQAVSRHVAMWQASHQSIRYGKAAGRQQRVREFGHWRLAIEHTHVAWQAGSGGQARQHECPVVLSGIPVCLFSGPHCGQPMVCLVSGLTTLTKWAGGLVGGGWEVAVGGSGRRVAGRGAHSWGRRLAHQKGEAQ